MFEALKNAWSSIKLLKKTEAAFAMASRGDDVLALEHLRVTEKALGRFTQYRFGVEPTLLEIFLRGSLNGIKADDYDWVSLKNTILSASEYNPAEKLHLLAYLEELATTAGVSLPMPELVSWPNQTEPVARRLAQQFPKLSEGS